MMNRGAAILSLTLLFSLISGCSTPDGEGEAAVPPVNPVPLEEEDNTTSTFYLLLPDPCPEVLVGNTTYINTIDVEERNCRTDLVESTSHCATFLVHDSTYTIQKNDSIELYIAIETPPGIDSSKFTWFDEEGVLAEARSSTSISPLMTPSIHHGETIAPRNSQGAIELVITIEDGYCTAIYTGGRSTSRFIVERA